MARDYIVDEVRRIREEQAAKYEFNIQTILAAAKKRQSRSGFKVVSFAQKSERLTKSSTRPPTKRAASDA
jgi:hypothetical protein